jgi:hypothetical protein
MHTRLNSIRNMLFAAMTVLALLSAPRTFSAETISLDGKSFIGEFVHKGRTSGDKDTIIFANGRFRSLACDRYGYGDAAYKATLEDNTIRFEAETVSPRYGKLVWKGTVKGDRLESAVTMLEPGRAPVDHRAWGDLKR